ncbi:hypothetical protein LB523_12305 [Mesorhizobium sp. ESP-6-4]|uniref:hypothetical protein n=1 Tax=Mesorhizobium sp. ESP-6-4 TaxID=2876624 RepID=UPI001CC90AEC|nr:hypothetical protein [Mesorhizobium sp. ESP-6-4]MBZ9659829.1 hypothetical protein [Mesorhizobium sp. ESP-6-4]
MSDHMKEMYEAAMALADGLDPAALEAATVAVHFAVDDADAKALAEAAIRAYLAASSAAPVQGKGVRQIIFDALDLSEELRIECTADVVNALTEAGAILPAGDAKAGAVEALHAQRLREVAAVLAAERIQGWANPLVCVLTDAADAIAGRQDFGYTGEVVLSDAASPVRVSRS